jgi:amidase
VPAHFCGVFGHKPTLGPIPLRGYSLPPAPPVPAQGDLAVIGPMARCAADLALSLDVIAGPDEAREGAGYRLALPPPRHGDLSNCRVLVVDPHPLMPTSNAVCAAIAGLAERLSRLGAKVAHHSALLPSVADSARLYMKLLNAARSPRVSSDAFVEAQRTAAALSPDDHSLQAEFARGTVMSHREWLATDAARARLQQQWGTLFREFDVVLYPSAAVVAFPHDHSEPIEARQIDIDGKAYPISKRSSYGRTRLRRAACLLPPFPSTGRLRDCPLGCKSLAHTSRIARRSPLPGFWNASSAASCLPLCEPRRPFEMPPSEA